MDSKNRFFSLSPKKCYQLKIEINYESLKFAERPKVLWYSTIKTETHLTVDVITRTCKVFALSLALILHIFALISA